MRGHMHFLLSVSPSAVSRHCLQCLGADGTHQPTRLTAPAISRKWMLAFMLEACESMIVTVANFPLFHG
jgi:hypothetical protein